MNTAKIDTNRQARIITVAVTLDDGQERHIEISLNGNAKISIYNKDSKGFTPSIGQYYLAENRFYDLATPDTLKERNPNKQRQVTNREFPPSPTHLS